jgi:hypothetical protein
MKTKFERFALGLLLAPPAPLAGLMGFWFLSYSFFPEKWIPLATLVGFVLGLLADFLFLKKLLNSVHRLSLVFWIAILLFYAGGLFGFFMGVPLFNAALAMPAGFVVGDRLARQKVDSAFVSRAAHCTAWFTTAVLLIVCIASAFFSLTSSSTPADLQGTLGLPFLVTWGMVWALILIGGTGLLVVNWALTVLSVRITYRFLGTP